MADDDLQWRERQRRAVRAHAEAEARQRAADQAEAAALVASFAAEAIRLGLRTTRLSARSYDGRARYRTRISGWYIDRAHTRAVDRDGRFHLLTVPASLPARLFGVDPQPDPPPLVLGKGGRDGESVPLRDALRRRLAAGDSWG
ncbi:hypothetical protein [Micromonospora aurantiaca]|uniref:hypothetical protein n=1 Tax=Micromonospora aurantiaca (nom. illeg.) TaxID=47850 RepID=UPI002E19041D